MKKNVEDRKLIRVRNKKDFQVDSSCGMHANLEFIRRVGLLYGLKKILKGANYKNYYGDYRLALATILCSIDGGEKVSDIPKFLSKNKNIRKSLGFKKVPAEETFLKFFERMGYKQEYMINKIKKLNKEFLEKYYINNLEDILLETDATHMSTSREDAKKNYKGERCYSILLEHIGQERMIYDWDFREGNVHVGVGIPDLLDEFIRAGYHKTKNTTFVSDSAGYQKRIIRRCKQEGINFIIKMNDSKALTDTVAENKQCEEYRTRESKMYLNSSHYVMDTPDLLDFRVILFNKKEELFHDGGIATNDEESGVKEIFGKYSQRMGEELGIREFKEGYGGDYIPSKFMESNEIFYALKILAYNLMNVLIHYLDKSDLELDNDHKYIPMRIKRFRYLFLDIAGEIVETSNKIFLNVNLEKGHFKLFKRFFNNCFGLGFMY